MTIEEKAKAYDEALKRAQKATRAGNDVAMDIVQYIFPQLTESENERIRKCIEMALTDVKEQRFKDYDTSLKDCLSWLEKQKEIPMPNSTELIEMWHNEKKMLKEKDFRDDPWRIAFNAFMGGFAKGTCVKLEKQKPVEKHDLVAQLKEHLANTPKEQLDAEWKALEKWNDVGPTVKEYLCSIKPSEQKYDGNMDKECIKLCDVLNSVSSIDTFESCCGHLKDRYSIWFFCNDIITISRLGRCVERNYSDEKWELLVDSTDTHPTGVFWLRSKVPFQSYDEMEESVNWLCDGIQYWFNTEFDPYFNDNVCEETTKQEEHWKPSDEQMEQLKSAADLPEFGPMVTTRKQFPDLVSLYDDLKKLM